MTFAGFLLFSDPPKPDAQQTIRDLTKLGIRIKVISGDNRYVTAHLAESGRARSEVDDDRRGN